jgi:hypothetical protein
VDVVSQQEIIFVLVELLASYLVSVVQINIFDLGLLLLFVVVVEIFSGLVQTFEEVHHVSKSNVDLKLIDVLEDLSSFDFAVDIEGDFRAVEAKTLLVRLHQFLRGFFL